MINIEAFRYMTSDMPVMAIYMYNMHHGAGGTDHACTWCNNILSSYIKICKKFTHACTCVYTCISIDQSRAKASKPVLHVHVYMHV